MSPQETAVIEINGKELALIEGPRFPPLPVFDENLDSYLAKTVHFKCDSREQFDAGKILALAGVALKTQVEQAFKPRKQAFDAAKQPTLDAEKELLAKINVQIKLIDTLNEAWRAEQQRIADAKAAADLKAETERREEARQAKIKIDEEARQAEIKRLEAERKQERQRLEAQRVKDADLALEWGEDDKFQADAINLPPIVEPPPVIVPEIIPPRPVKADLGFAGRKGSRTKLVLKHKIVDPEAINEKYKSADPMKIKARIANYTNLVKDPTEEQIAKLAEEIGKGVELFWE